MATGELDAIREILAALEPMDDAQRLRVVRYVIDFLGMEVASALSKQGTERSPTMRPVGLAASSGWLPNVTDFADLFAAAQPQSDKERALVAGYWEQVFEGAENFVSATLNLRLKHLGHGVGNITDALERLIEEKPQLVLQLRKEGNTKQARKTYKLTHEGIKRVEVLTQRSSSNG
jgi:hypothetical protein